MSDWLTIHTLIAFILGVLLSASAKGLVSSVRSRATGG